LQKGKLLNLALVAGLLGILAFVAGCVPAAGGEPGQDMGIVPMIVFVVLLFAMVYFLMIRPQRRRQKEHEELMADLKKGDRVITAGGIYGQIESTAEDSVVLKVESGATIRVARNSIGVKRSK